MLLNAVHILKCSCKFLYSSLYLDHLAITLEIPWIGMLETKYSTWKQSSCQVWILCLWMPSFLISPPTLRQYLSCSSRPKYFPYCSCKTKTNIWHFFHSNKNKIHLRKTKSSHIIFWDTLFFLLGCRDEVMTRIFVND